jgi:hypothetical protein
VTEGEEQCCSFSDVVTGMAVLRRVKDICEVRRCARHICKSTYENRKDVKFNVLKGQEYCFALFF